ncbi:hypothetical protein TWF730_002660 [Orbilia blumenaviensis]|uniref:Uncharacterized protein n=1 Tax=Orbilia blumenaviensis TaxID=1796055 RepID=A0AAV9U715_9PEZI
MPVAIEYHGLVVQFELVRDMGALAHHYSQFVIDNVAALFISQSTYVVPGNWRQCISALLQPALVNRRLQNPREQGGGGCTDEADYYLEDRHTKERDEHIAS